MAEVEKKPADVCCNEASDEKKTQGKVQQKGGKKGGGGGAKKGGANVEVQELSPPPAYIQHRVEMFEKIKKDQESQGRAQNPIKITLPDGKVLDGVSFKTTPHEIASGISKGLANACVAAKVDDVMWDLFRPIEADCKLELVKFDSPEGKKVFWHSSAHVLGQAIERRFGVNLCIGPALEEGFYYDAHGDQFVVTDEHWEELNALATKIASEKQPYERIVLTKEQALEMFKHNPFKVQIISSKVPDGECCTAYRCGPLIDLCRGPHLPNTGYVKSFCVTKNSSAYWLGKAENESLQRIYGISFPDNKQMNEWVEFQKQAAERDHRNIGKKQELFFFHPLSPGSAFMLPHGTRVYNRLMDYLRGEYRKRGFQEVVSPNVYNADLWKQSGHWANYSENMFSFKCEDQDFALKPMNCPGHCLMFAHRTRSYRELPLRLADFGVLHRNELSGALTGLTRVRRFQQDDAHIFCRQDQIKQEIASALDFMESVYGVFGFKFDLELSTRPEKYLGEVAMWNDAEKQLEDVLNACGKPWKLNPGDGAFYGPKIDIHVRDALNRSHQCATIQLDFQLPIRFKLEYQGESQYETPVIVHRAILGSVERFFAILIEHTAGLWPFWISPRQVTVLPISNKFNDYAKKVGQAIEDAGYFVDLDVSDEIFGKKMSEARVKKYNYIIVCGQQEEQDNTVNVRLRDGTQLGAKTLDELLKEFKENCATFTRVK